LKKIEEKDVFDRRRIREEEKVRVRKERNNEVGNITHLKRQDIS